MFTTLRTAAVAGLIGLTSLAAVPAQADGLFDKRQDGARFGFFLADGRRPHDRLRERELRRVERPCTAQLALDKAQRIGVRRARIDYVRRRSIGVVGRSRGDWIHVTFSRAPNCPVTRID